MTYPYVSMENFLLDLDTSSTFTHEAIFILVFISIPITGVKFISYSFSSEAPLPTIKVRPYYILYNINSHVTFNNNTYSFVFTARNEIVFGSCYPNVDMFLRN